ncbi:hypothetical protein MMC10_009442 [Thelotrema lepadinum]|nr:hypothetical protein [Thelotrema lepadinum]
MQLSSFFVSIALLALQSTPISSHPLLNRDAATKEFPTRTVYQFANNTWAENIAVRSNGNLLITRADVPELWQIANPDSRSPSASLVHRFSDKLALTGIAETTPDTFALIAGNFSLTAGNTPGASSIYTVTFPTAQCNSSTVSVAKIADIPTGVFLNGMSSLSPSAVLVGDLGAGTIYRVAIPDGTTTLFSNDSLLAPAANPAFGPVGVNGLHVATNPDTKAQTVFFANSGQNLLGSFPLSPNGTQAAPAVVVSRPLNASEGYDDFALAPSSSSSGETQDASPAIFAVTGGGNSVEKVNTATGKGRIIAGSLNSTAIAQPTAAGFGRGEEDGDGKVLYVTTAGGLAIPVDGNKRVGAQVVAVYLGMRG